MNRIVNIEKAVKLSKRFKVDDQHQHPNQPQPRQANNLKQFTMDLRPKHNPQAKNLG
jgi:hypothetical protein